MRFVLLAYFLTTLTPLSLEGSTGGNCIFLGPRSIRRAEPWRGTLIPILEWLVKVHEGQDDAHRELRTNTRYFLLLGFSERYAVWESRDMCVCMCMCIYTGLLNQTILFRWLMDSFVKSWNWDGKMDRCSSVIILTYSQFDKNLLLKNYVFYRL